MHKVKLNPVDLATLGPGIGPVFLRKSSVFENNAGYGRAGKLFPNNTVLIIHVENDGDCFILTTKGYGWLMQESLQAITERKSQ